MWNRSRYFKFKVNMSSEPLVTRRWHYTAHVKSLSCGRGMTGARRRELNPYHSEAVWHRVPTAPGTVVTKTDRSTELIQRHRTTVTQIEHQSTTLQLFFLFLRRGTSISTDLISMLHKNMSTADISMELRYYDQNEVLLGLGWSETSRLLPMWK